MRRSPAGTKNAHPSQLRCEQCGLVYSRAAIAREITMATGIDCRRCGGALHHTEEAPAQRAGVAAVRASVGGPGRRTFD